MKKTKLLSLLMAIIFVLTSIAACQQNTPNIPDDSEPGNEDISPETPNDDEPEIPDPAPIDPVVPSDPVIDPEPEYIYPSEEILYLRENLPIMDGSTSLILLEMGLKSKIYGIPFVEALSMVEHTTTYGAFERLLNKEVDIIFSTPLSDEQYDQAAQKGMDLELVPIAAEAFVFIVNADNPVDSLSQQQIKDIYSGKITNWKEVGGEDIEIVAFQRDRTSGSQNYMRDFMGETKLMVAPTEKVPDAMDSLVNAIKSYDNSKNAIGYSVYAYAADMYGLGDSLKFIKVDGVEPSKETISDKTYPLVNYNYAIYNKNDASESVLKTVEWFGSYDCQVSIAEAGYVPYGNVKTEYLEITGTGTPKEEAYKEPSVSFNAVSIFNKEDYTVTRDRIMVYRTEGNTTKQAEDSRWEINFLKDKKLEAEINAKLAEFEARAEERIHEVDKYQKVLNELSSHTFNKTAGIYQEYQYSPAYKDVEMTIRNGYMCILSVVKYMDGADREYCYYAETAYYDLINGKEIQLSDLFYEGVDVDNVLYEMLTSRPLGSYNQGFFLPAVTYSDITKLSSTEHFALTFDEIYFNYNNPIFCIGEILSITLNSGYMCVEIPNEMDGLFDESIYTYMTYIGNSSNDYEYVSMGKYNDIEYTLRLKLLPETGKFSENNKLINENAKKYLVDNYNCEKLSSQYLAIGYTEDQLKEYVLAEFYGLRSFALTEYSGQFAILDDNVVFDGITGEICDISIILKDGWEEHITISKSGDIISGKYRSHTDEESELIEQNIIPPNAYFNSFNNDRYKYDVPEDGESYLSLIYYCPDSQLNITVYVNTDYVKKFND